MKIYTMGYSRLKFEDIKRTAETLDAIVIDARFSPGSRNPTFRKAYLQKHLGQRYVHLQELGNENYKGGPIKLHDMEAGAAKVAAILPRFPVILLCICRDLATCHRRVAAEELARRLTVPVVHLDGPVGGRDAGGGDAAGSRSAQMRLF